MGSRADAARRVDALGFDELGRSAGGPPIRGRRFGRRRTALLVFGGIHGDEPASVEALIELAGRLSAGRPAAPRRRPSGCCPRSIPTASRAGSKNSARDVDLNRNFPARSFVTAHAPGYFPGPAPLSEPGDARDGRPVAREPIAAVVAVHAPFACMNYDGPAARLGRGGCRGVRLARPRPTSAIRRPARWAAGLGSIAACRC